MEWVRLTTVAAIMGVTDGWMRGLVYQKVMDDERENPVKGAPYVMHLKQVVQAIVAQRCRRRNVGYDLIRDAVDKFEVFGKQFHIVPVERGMDLRLHRKVLTDDAREILRQANEITYGSEEAA